MRVELILFFLVSLTLTSCSNDEKKSVVKTQRNYPVDSFKNYSFNLINTDYDFDMKSRKFKINFYKFSDSIKLSKSEENRIANEFFEKYIDTLTNDNMVSDENEIMIMPSSGDSFYIYYKGFNRSFIRILNGDYKNIDDLSDKDKNILTFKKNLFEILKQNPDFKRSLDNLKSVKKYDDRIFM